MGFCVRRSAAGWRLEDSAAWARRSAHRRGPESRLVSKSRLIPEPGLRLILSSGRDSVSRNSGSSCAGAGKRRCWREHKLPLLILALIFVDLDTGALMRAGDSGDRADLVAVAHDWGRGRLARVG